MLKKLGKVDLIYDHLKTRMQEISNYEQKNKEHFDSPLDGPQVSNTGLFRVYTEAYLRSRPDIHQEGFPLVVRSLEPTATGLPIEVYVFTRTIEWAAYEKIQSEIFDHLLAAASYFNLRVFQEPTGKDFYSLANK